MLLNHPGTAQHGCDALYVPIDEIEATRLKRSGGRRRERGEEGMLYVFDELQGD